MISSVYYNGDGATRIFPVSFKIQGDDYVRLYVDEVEVFDRTSYDIINNSIVFSSDNVPPVGVDNVKIYVATSVSELGDLGASISDISNVANNLDNINLVASNMDLIIGQANGEYIVSSLPASAQQGDVAVNVADGNIYVYDTEDGWVYEGESGTSSDSIITVPTLPVTGVTEGTVMLNTTDNKFYKYTNGAWAVVTLTTGVAQEVADASITTAKFASGIVPVELFDALPSSGNFNGRIGFLKTDFKLYRHNGTAWVSTVPATDLTGSIVATQITDGAITTPKLSAGSVTSDIIGANAITAGKIATNAVTAGTIAVGAVNADQIAAGAIRSDKIYSNAIQTYHMAAGSINADRIQAGTLTADKIVSNSLTRVNSSKSTGYIYDNMYKELDEYVVEAGWKWSFLFTISIGNIAIEDAQAFSVSTFWINAWVRSTGENLFTDQVGISPFGSITFPITIDNTLGTTSKTVSLQYVAQRYGTWINTTIVPQFSVRVLGIYYAK